MNNDLQYAANCQFLIDRFKKINKNYLTKVYFFLELGTIFAERKSFPYVTFL